MSAVRGLISHDEMMPSLEIAKEEIKARIIKDGNKQHAPIEHQLAILEALSEFDFGRFLIQNRGINGYWTHYMLTHPQQGRKTGLNNRNQPFSELEAFLLDTAPTMLATQQRFEIFLQQNQSCIKEGASLSCIPCGLMAELLYLDFSEVESVHLMGIDLDSQSLCFAKKLDKKKV